MNCEAMMHKMMRPSSLRLHLYLILALLAATNLAGGSIAAWYFFRMSQILTSVIDKDVAFFLVEEHEGVLDAGETLSGEAQLTTILSICRGGDN
jgi:hypothetical protein